AKSPSPRSSITGYAPRPWKFRAYTRAVPPRKQRPSRKGLTVGRDVRETSKALRRFALGLPGATEHFPWGERVAKIAGKVFVFLGTDPLPDGEIGRSEEHTSELQSHLNLV